MAENQKGRKVKVLRFDNEGEISTEFKSYLADKCIEHHLSIPGWLEQNGVAEHMNRTRTEHARSIRLQADMSEGFWAESVNQTINLVNMLTSTAIDLQIPEEIWRGVSVDYSTLRFFGCRIIVWLIVRKGTNWSPCLRSVSSSGSPKESKISDFGISRKGSLLPAEMWYLIKNQCC